MEERPLGRVDLMLPVIGMGTWKTFDVEGAERNARRRLVREALDEGIRLFDTSPMYGRSPDVLADALQNCRDEATVADKVWASSKEEGLRQIERSIRMFGGEVDILQVHNLRLAETHLPEIERRKKRDEVRAVGATHYNHNAFDELEALMKSGRLDMVQIPYNVVDRVAERRLLPLADKMGIGVLVMEPLGTGALARRPPPQDALAPWLGDGVETWAQVLLKWILSDPRVTAVLPATTNPEHMRQNARAGRGRWFDPKEREEIVKLAGGPPAA